MSNHISWPYVAGFFDGEGTFNTSSSRGTSYYASFAQADEYALQRIQTFLAECGVDSRLYKTYKKDSYTKSTKDLWCLNVYGRDNLTAFLRNMLPYVHIKKAKVQDILRFFCLYPTRNPRARGKLNNVNARRMASRHAA